MKSQSDIAESDRKDAERAAEVVGAASTDHEISLDRIWLRISRFRLQIAALALAAALAALAGGLLMEPVYRVEAVLSPAEFDRGAGGLAVGGQLGSLAALAGVNLSGGSTGRDESIALLRSRSLLIQFVVEKNLLPVLFAGKWDETNGAWRVADTDEVPTIWDAVDYFRTDILTISESPKNKLVSLRIDWKDPEVAAQWADELVVSVNEAARARAMEEAEKNLAFLREYLARTELISIQQAVNGLIEDQTRQLMLATVQKEYAFRVVDPAVAPDLDDPQSPKLMLIVLLGLVFGTVLGLIAAVLRGD